MTTWQQLRDLKLSEYEDAADGWGRVSARANAAKDRVDNEMLSKLRETQKGETATRAVSDLSQLSRNYQYIHSECGLVRTALNGLASELAVPQKKLTQALEDAENLKFTVQPDGSVQYPASAPVPFAPGTGTASASDPNFFLTLPGDGPDPNKVKAGEIADRIASAVGDANEVDARYANVLRGFGTTGGLQVTDAMLADAAKDTRSLQQAAGKYAGEGNIPKDKSPAENKAWWEGLTQEQRDEYATLYPADIGALNGLPSEVRDDANRMVLAETSGQTRLDLAALGPEPPKMAVTPYGMIKNPDWVVWEAGGGSHLTASLKGMDAIQKRFDAPNSSGLPPAFLLGFDAKGTGRAIIANGNPDTADHTAVYVPGTTSRLEGIGGDINRMGQLWTEGNAQDPGESLSTITWLGYDAPQSIVPEAMQQHWADDGAPRLNSFMDGLEAAQGGPDASHTTIIGHSYGSTVVGDASIKGDLAADDIVVAGSPGMLVDDAKDLDVGKDHVWSEAAGNDPVPLGGKAAGLGGTSWGVQTWHGIPYAGGFVQKVPSDESFGAHRMDVDTSGHSGYWDPGSQSLKNQAFVVTGQYGSVEED